MKKIKAGILFSLLSCSSVMVSAQAFTFFEDFESVAAGGFPSGSGYPAGVTVTRDHQGVQRIVQVVDSNSNPADPFGPTGNHSLLIARPTGGSGIPRASWRTPDFIDGKGEVSFKLLIGDERAGISQASTVNLFIASGSIATNAIAGVLSFSNRNLSIWVDGTSAGNATMTNAINYDEEVTVRVMVMEDKFSVFLNDTIVELSGRTEFDFRSTFAYDNINYVQFASAWNADTNTYFYIDDLAISSIPEGATLGLMFGATLVGLMGWGRYRKNIHSRSK